MAVMFRFQESGATRRLVADGDEGFTGAALEAALEDHGSPPLSRLRFTYGGCGTHEIAVEWDAAPPNPNECSF